MRDGGCYGHVDGPRFNTKAEIRGLAGVGVTAVSQTAGPETVLAGEAELPFALVGYATDYANGVQASATPVERLLELIAASTDTFARVLAEALPRIDPAALAPAGDRVPVPRRVTGRPAATRCTARRSRPPRSCSPARRRRPACSPGSRRVLDAARRAALQTLLVRRAAAWACAAAPGGAAVAVAVAAGGASEREAALAEVAALVPAEVEVFAQAGADAVRRGDRARRRRPGAPRAGRLPAPRPRARGGGARRLAEGCDVVFGATLEGGWYLAGLREPRPELLTVVPGAGERLAGIGTILERARAHDASVGMLRHERMVATPGDVAALLADPLLDRSCARRSAARDADGRLRAAGDPEVRVAVGRLARVEVVRVVARPPGRDAVVAREPVDRGDQRAPVRRPELAARVAEVELEVDQTRTGRPRPSRRRCR